MVSLEVITFVAVLALFVLQGYLWNLSNTRMDGVEKKIKRVIDVMPRIQQLHFKLEELKKERDAATKTDGIHGAVDDADTRDESDGHDREIDPLRQMYDDRIRKLEAEIEEESR